MDKAEQTIILNIKKITGKSIEDWVKIVENSGLNKHGEIVKMLKNDHGFTHGYANYVTHKYFKSDAGSVDNTALLISGQYKGEKQVLFPIYELLIKKIEGFGKDVIIAPKKTYVSLKRKKQFALLQPSTKTRLDIGINLKGIPPTDRLELSGSFNAMCTHRVRIDNIDNIDNEVVAWLKKAYDLAG